MGNFIPFVIRKRVHQSQYCLSAQLHVSFERTKCLYFTTTKSISIHIPRHQSISLSCSLKAILCSGHVLDLRSSLQPTCCHRFPVCPWTSRQNPGWLLWEPDSPHDGLVGPNIRTLHAGTSQRWSWVAPVFTVWLPIAWVLLGHTAAQTVVPLWCLCKLLLLFSVFASLLSEQNSIFFSFRLSILFIMITFTFNPEF